MIRAERQGMRGRLTLVLRDAHGDEVDRREVDNLITLAGRKLVARLFSGDVKVVPKVFIVVGTGSAVAQETDTTLQQEVASVEANASANGNLARVSGTFTTGAEDKALTEAGIRFELGPEKILYNRVIFKVINKLSGMEMTLSWEVAF